MRSDKQPGVIVRSRETSDGYRRIPASWWKTGHRFLPSLGKFGFRSDEAVAYNYHAAYYLGGKLNRITEWQHDLDENYLEHWRQPKLRRRMRWLTPFLFANVIRVNGVKECGPIQAE